MFCIIKRTISDHWVTALKLCYNTINKYIVSSENILNTQKCKYNFDYFNSLKYIDYFKN